MKSSSELAKFAIETVFCWLVLAQIRIPGEFVSSCHLSVAMPVTAGLLVKHHFAKKIFKGKTWEIRSKNCHKRGPIGIVSTTSSSPGKKALLLGEAVLSRTLVVAERQNGQLVPPRDNPGNFMFNADNLQKHQVTLEEFPELNQYQVVYAWEFSDALEYEEPKVQTVKKGCVTWMKLCAGS